jgi:hypothetical protein
MPIYDLVLFGFAAAILLSATALLNSRVLSEKMVGRNVISRFVADMFPVLASVCRVLGVFLVIVGFCWAGINAGWISRMWMERYGLPALLVGVGLFMVIRFRKH